jgi:uncharacterized membrane protein YfcA
LTTLLLAAIATAVGFFIGAVGVGGILLIPALVLLGGLDIHQATATALFTFLFTGCLGSWLFQRRGSIDWKMTVPVCAGAVIFSFLGAMANSMIAARMLALIIAAIIIFAGAYILRPVTPGAGVRRDGKSARQRWLLLAVGAASGFGSGLSGAGGPLFSVPIMLLLGFAPLATIGTSQVLQIIAATAGTAGNLRYGSVDFHTAAWIAAFELAGVIAGTRAAHAVGVTALRRMAAGLCIAVGLFMLVRAA